MNLRHVLLGISVTCPADLFFFPLSPCIGDTETHIVKVLERSALSRCLLA